MMSIKHAFTSEKSDTADATLLQPSNWNEDHVLTGENFGFIGAKAKSLDITFGTGSYTAIPLDTEDFDTDGFHSNVTDNTRMTIPAGLGGKYLISFRIDHYNGNHYSYIRKGGATNVWSYGYGSGAGTDYVNNGTFVLELAAGEYIELMLSVSSSTLKVGELSIVKLDSGHVGQGVGAKVYNSGTQSINDSLETVLTFNTEDFDTDGFHSTSVNTGRLTVPAGLGGKYLVQGSLFAPFTAVGYKYLGFYKNGNTSAMVRRVAPSLGAEDSSEITDVFDLAAGDYLELVFVHNNGSPQNVGHASARRAQNQFSIMRLDSGGGGHVDDYQTVSDATVVTSNSGHLHLLEKTVAASSGWYLVTAEWFVNATNAGRVYIAQDGVQLGNSRDSRDVGFCSIQYATKLVGGVSYVFTLVFESEGSNVTFGLGGDNRWERWLKILGPLGRP